MTYFLLKVDATKKNIFGGLEIHILAASFIKLDRYTFCSSRRLVFSCYFFAASGKQVLLLNTYIKPKGNSE